MSEDKADPSRRWLTHGRIEGGQSVLFLLSETEKPHLCPPLIIITSQS